MTNKNSRTGNSVRNALTGVIYKLINIITPFIVRTIILHVLGTKYLGLNGLFTSILQILNLTELGFTSAIVYTLYDPIATKDEKQINCILNLISKVYTVIGILIFAVGLIISPFLGILTNGECPDDVNLMILYLLYLANTSASYLFFSYRNCLLTASQRSDITNFVHSVCKIGELILHVIILLVLKNIYLYVFAQILCTLSYNIATYIITKKKFPQYRPKGKVNKDKSRQILKQIFGIMFDKVCCVTRNSFDSIFISMFLGLNIVAKYENYSYVTNALYGIINIASISLIASVGESVVRESSQKNYKDMNELMFLFAWLYGWMAITLLCLFQPFISIWMGESMMLPMNTVILFPIYFYILCMGMVRAIYVQATGIWWQEKNRAIVETIANLLLNTLLVKLFGLCGIIIGTCLSLFFINFVYGSRYIFKYYFLENNIISYFKSHFIYVLSTIILGGITWIICGFVNSTPIKMLVYRAVVCILVPNILLISIISVLNSKYKVYIKDMKNRIIGLLK